MAGPEEILQELTDIALGRKGFAELDKAGNTVEAPPSMTARLKALELLGKRYRLFSEAAPAAADTGLTVNVKVLEGEGR